MGLDGSLGAVTPQTLGLARNCEEDPSLTLMGLDGSLGAVSPQTLGLARNCEEDPPPTLMGLDGSLGQSLHRRWDWPGIVRKIHHQR